MALMTDAVERQPTEDHLALVLSGGGARAAYQIGILSAIAERFPELRIPILTGVSAGRRLFLGKVSKVFPELRRSVI